MTINKLISSQSNSERNVLEEVAQGVVSVPSVEEEEEEEGEEEGEEEAEEEKDVGASKQPPPSPQQDDDDVSRGEGVKEGGG